MENLSTKMPFLPGLILKAALILLSLFITTSVKASYVSGVVINELAWTGTKDSYSDEWIELYNNNDFDVDINGWILKSTDGTPEINLIGTILAKNFYLLERTDEDTVPSVAADQVYKGALDNKGEYLQLFDDKNNLIDEVNCSDGWFSGDNSTKQTMERKSSQLSGNNHENWQVSQNPEGTPKSGNSLAPEKTQPLVVKNEETMDIKTSKVVSYPSGIVFTEVLPSPEGPDNQEEWIEIFNENDFDVDLSGWKISDSVGVIKIYTFPNGTNIKAGEFLVLVRPETKITLNNGGDSLNLIQPDDNLTDSVIYEKAPLGQSYNLTNSGWAWSNVLTPGTINNSMDLEPQGNEKSNEIEKRNEELASVGEQVFKRSFSFFNVLSVAFLLATLSAVLILFLKKKMTKVDFF